MKLCWDVCMQAEHERVQSRLFELQESKEAASGASAAADDFDSQQREALTQQVRWVLAACHLATACSLPKCTVEHIFDCSEVLDRQ